MAIPVQIPVKEYTGNGSATRFDFAPHFTLSAADHLEVFLDGELQTSGYTQDSTGITFATAPATGVAIRLQRHTPADQPTTLSGLRAFGLSAIAVALDRIARLFQELRYALDGKAALHHTHPVTDLTGDPESNVQFMANAADGVDLAIYDATTATYRRVTLANGQWLLDGQPAPCPTACGTPQPEPEPEPELPPGTLTLDSAPLTLAGSYLTLA